MKQDERCTRCGGEIFPNAGEQWPDGWIHSEPNNCYLTALARAEAAEAAETEAVDLHRQLAEMAAAMEEIEAERLALAARVAELEARAEAAEKLVAELKFERNAAARRAYNTEVDNQQLTAENRRLAARVAELEAQLAAQQWRPVTEDWPPYNISVPVRLRDGSIRWGYRHGDRWNLTGGKYGIEAITHAYELPPAPQETE